MKALLFTLAMTLPATAIATAAMEPQQTSRLPQDAARTPPASPAKSRPHRSLFVVKYVLRPTPPEETPRIVMDDAAPQIAPPTAGGYATPALGAWHRDPNTFICYGRGCQGF